MAIKVSILVTTYRKEVPLPNTFFSISQQMTDFEFEVCVLDDCSPIDPKPLFDEYLQVEHKKYSRLLQHIGDFAHSLNFPRFPGFTSSYGLNAAQMDPESEIVVLMNADVIWTQTDMLQRFVDAMRPDEIQLCRVANLMVDSELHRDWQERVEKLRTEAVVSQRSYQGLGRAKDTKTLWKKDWFPFLAPFYKTDLFDETRLGFLCCCLDTQLSQKMHTLNFTPIWREDMIGVHQAHASIPKVLIKHESQLRHWSSKCPERQEYPDE